MTIRTVAHDFWFSRGGAERVTKLLYESLSTEQRLIVLAGDREKLAADNLSDAKIIFPHASSRNYRQLSIAYPYMLRTRDPIDGDLICSSYAFSHHLKCSGRKFVYCHSPLRQVWSGKTMYSNYNPLYRAFDGMVGRALRSGDKAAALTANSYIANSKAVQKRIGEYYGLFDVPVVYPPVSRDIKRMEVDRDGGFVWAGRIVEPYKRLGIVLEAFEDLPYTLTVVGDGRDRDRLSAKATSNVRFVGEKTTEELAEIYSRARAVIFPSEDDFGLIPVEAMRCGTPVIAFGSGGALETVRDGETGLFFYSQESQSLRSAIDLFLQTEFDHDVIEAYSEAFSERAFLASMHDVVSGL